MNKIWSIHGRLSGGPAIAPACSTKLLQVDHVASLIYKKKLCFQAVGFTTNLFSNFHNWHSLLSSCLIPPLLSLSVWMCTTLQFFRSRYFRVHCIHRFQCFLHFTPAVFSTNGADVPLNLEQTSVYILRIQANVNIDWRLIQNNFKYLFVNCFFLLLHMMIHCQNHSYNSYD
jgi:hypothetical protein